MELYHLDPDLVGRCPAGNATSGQIRINLHARDTANDLNAPQNGPVEVDILSGITCRPESLCHLTGSIADNETGSGAPGKVITVRAFAVVDNEGGTADKAWVMYINNNESGVGTMTTTYKHPSGFQCNWATDILLERPRKDGE